MPSQHKSHSRSCDRKPKKEDSESDSRKHCSDSTCDVKRQVKPAVARTHCKAELRSKLDFPIQIKAKTPICVPNKHKKDHRGSTCDEVWTHCPAEINVKIDEEFVSHLKVPVVSKLKAPRCDSRKCRDRKPHDDKSKSRSKKSHA